MNSIVSPEIRELINVVHYRPAISVVLPFEPKMGGKVEIMQSLKFAVDKVQREIFKKYPDDLGKLVVDKLKKIIKDLNFNTYKKSIGIFVSPVFEKVLYLDIPVEEKIIIDESFEIRDLVYAKKEIHKYLVVVLSAKQSKVFIGNTSSFMKIKSNARDHSIAMQTDMPERVGNFSDPSEVKETLLKKFLLETDHGLSYLLKIYQLPVFVIGAKKVLGYFNELSVNTKHIAHYITGNYEKSTEDELRALLEPYISDWKKLKMDDLKLQIEHAAGIGKLSTGIQEVWKSAFQKKGRLLIVERNFMCTAVRGGEEGLIDEEGISINRFSIIKDAVDDVIEKVLDCGGDVEFVDKGILKEDKIALIHYY